jgi:serine/threonine-protein kinase
MSAMAGFKVPWALPERFQVLRVLGSGGMGTVLLARERELGRLVALKFLRETGPLFLQRFRREARLMARLAHPAIVPVYEFAGAAERPYLALAYLDGGNLAQARLAPEALARTLHPVTDALASAHRHGIVHRDVKPENVLLDRGGRAFLTDFGLALEPGEGPAHARAAALAGTPLCMSPEQARGAPLGPESDQFSFGTLLYRQLTGQWPFRGRSLIDVLYAVEHASPVRPRALVPQLSRALERVVLRALEKDPARRFAGMEELGQSLLAGASGRSLFARALDLVQRRSLPPRARAPLHPPSLLLEERP